MIDYEKLGGYFGGDPFPHVVIDDFLLCGFSEMIAHGFDYAFASQHGKSHRNTVRFKRHQNSLKKMTRLQQELFHELNGLKFRKALSEMTGKPQIIPDPTLKGGGLHEIGQGGYLNIHTDFNRHPALRKYRILNLLLFLNKDWKPEYHGNLELWNPDLTRCVKSIEPIDNRVVLFETSDFSWHGHPVPLEVPKDVSRKSVAVYYYADWPKGQPVRNNTNYVKVNHVKE